MTSRVLYATEKCLTILKRKKVGVVFISSLPSNNAEALKWGVHNLTSLMSHMSPRLLPTRGILPLKMLLQTPRPCMLSR